MKSSATNKIIYNRFDEIWTFDLADFSEYRTSNTKRFRYIFVIFDNFSKCLWCIPLQTKLVYQSYTRITKILTTSKRSPFKFESDRGADIYNSIFQNFIQI